MAQARGQLSITTEATRAIVEADGFLPLTSTSFPLLVTALSDATSFDMPLSGRLRYVGANAGTFSIQATISARISDLVGVNVEFRLGKNGTTISSSKSLVSLADLWGTQNIPLQTVVGLVTNDYVEVFAKAYGAANLTIDDLPLLAAAVSFTPTAGLVTEAALRAFALFIAAGADVDDDLAAARALMAHCIDAHGIDPSLAYQIELRLAAHFAALRFGAARITREAVAGATDISYAVTSGTGLRATQYGLSALALDPTGCLEGIGVPSERVALFRVV